MVQLTSLTLYGPLLTPQNVGGVRLEHHHTNLVMFGLGEAAKWELAFITGRLSCCTDVTGQIMHGKRAYGLVLYGTLVDEVNKDVFDAIDQMPKHGGILLYAITAVYNPLLPLITGDQRAHIPRTLAEFVAELTYPLLQRAWYIIYDRDLPDR